jgi:3-dehydroquinate synthetase
MYMATLLGVATNRLRERDASRIMRLIASVGPLPRLTGIRAKDLRAILAGDKKAHSGRVLWVLPRRIGTVEWDREIPWPVVSRAFSELPEIAETAREAAD